MGRPEVRLELTGMMPPEGCQWCATCAMLYLGVIADSPDMRQRCQEKIQAAEEKGNVPAVYVALPERNDYVLRIAVTAAPSVYFHQPMPVCWIHLIPYNADMRMQQAANTTLIPGKSNNWKRNMS